MRLERNGTFTRPGVIMLVTGVVGLLTRGFIDKVPLVGGMLSWVFLLGGVFFVVGGIFLLLELGNN